MVSPGRSREASRLQKRGHHIGNFQRGWCTRVDITQHSQRLALSSCTSRRTPHLALDGPEPGWEEPLRDVSGVLSPKHSSAPFFPPGSSIIFKHKYIAFKETYLPATYERSVLSYGYLLFSSSSPKLTFTQPAVPALTSNTLMSKVWLSPHSSLLCFAC